MKQYPTTMFSRFFPMILMGISLCATCFFPMGCEKEPPPPPPPPEVAVTAVVQKDVPIYSVWVASADGLINATIRAQVIGYLSGQQYQEGDVVKKGDVLFTIDPRPFQAALDQAKAQLALQQARWNTAKLDLNRIRPLAEANAVSKKDLDDAIGLEQATHAAVLGARANVEEAQINLDFTTIESPIDGVAGFAQAQIGDLVGTPGSPELTTVSTIDPIKVYFSISEQEYLQVMGETTAERQAMKKRSQDLELILADGSVYPHKGSVSFADRQVDIGTGTITVAALFPNPERLLRPGQFAKIRAVTEEKKGALLVPQRAVMNIQGKNLLAVVGADNKVDLRPVTVAEQTGSDFIISEGLKAGETIIVEGIQKVKAGEIVNPKPSADETRLAPAKPEEKPAPSPSTEKR